VAGCNFLVSQHSNLFLITERNVTRPKHIRAHILTDISGMASGLPERESVAEVTAAGSYVMCIGDTLPAIETA
jgi:hypothetical protein